MYARRMRAAEILVAAIAATALGCGGGETRPGSAGPACAAPEVALPDGSCIRPGVPLDGCGSGFTHDADYGCTPVLPAAACPPGAMAVPGDTDCRPVSPCGA